MTDQMTLGFLGFGEMGSAIAAGLARFSPDVQSGALTMYAYAPHTDKLRKRAASLPVTVCGTAAELVEKSHFVVLACKPDQVKTALEGLDLTDRALVSIVNAWTQTMYRDLLGETRVQCVMPNTPVKVGRGVMLFSEENSLLPAERDLLKAWFGTVSAVVELPEAKIRAATAISGCGPAFLYMVIEALGDAGVKNGLKRQMAYELAAATVVGAGQMVLEQQGHPAALKDAVCSPGGTTIRGVAALEEDAMRAAFIHAVDATLG